MTTEALDALESIRRNPRLFTGQFPDHIIQELRQADLVETYWSEPGALFGLSRVRVKEGK